MFLENLTKHGKSYKLQFSQKDEEPRFLYYEDLQTRIDNQKVRLNKKKRAIFTTQTNQDLDVVILDNYPNCSEVNDKQPTFAEKEPSLREKLVHILKQPYNEKEHEELSDAIEQKKPMSRHLDLRSRAISSAFGGAEKSLLDNISASFRWMYNAAQNDPPKALNLLRMFYFWLEHVPNEDAFAPWKDKQILKVRPSEKKALN
ncbi:hypothetical protein QVD17_39297 [Tagetes erecta]|uniref:Uncharacterized protein n=1 Tax=Tagetes erecta TaxID=13708 RepID=A0AAD8JNA2_TARER|nr:hypothetical protein QVD17_39297 [Tagetes erecta]